MLTNWGYYPVKYDSVLEHSNHAWVITGDPNMRDVFKRYSTNNVEIFLCPHGYPRDPWSVSTFKSILKDSKNKPVLNESKNLFVILLPDQDYIGHNDPKNYSKMVSNIDRNVKKITRITHKYFQDNLTSFLFTSDHGSFQRSHDQNVDDNLLTPFVAWGAGIEADLRRKDVNNNDIAPLISALLGIYFPTNSLGKVPLKYMNIGNRMKLQIFSQNLLQIFNILKAKQERLWTHMSILKNNIKEFHSNQSRILRGIMSEDEYEEVHIQLIEAMREIHRCFIFDILILSSVYLFFWLLYLTLMVVPDDNKNGTKQVHDVIGYLFLGWQISLIIVFSFLNIFIIFILLAFGSLILCLTQARKIPHLFRLVYIVPPTSQKIRFFVSIISIAFGVYYHEILSLPAIFMIPIAFCFEHHNMNEGRLRFIWIALCVVLACLISITHDIRRNIDINNVIGSSIWHFLIVCFLFKILSYRENLLLTKTQIFINSVQLFCSLSMSIFRFLRLNQEYFVVYIAFISLALIPFSMKNQDVRIITVFMAFTTVYMIGAEPFELIFHTFFTMLLLTWKIVESETSKISDLKYFWNCWILIGVNILGSFGTNYCDFHHNNGYMGEKLRKLKVFYLLKLMTPLICSGCVFHCIVSKIEIDMKIFSVILEILFGSTIFCFIFTIHNEGFWAEIGRSVARFGIVNSFSLAVMFLHSVSYFLMHIGSSNVLEKVKLFLK